MHDMRKGIVQHRHAPAKIQCGGLRLRGGCEEGQDDGTGHKLDKEEHVHSTLWEAAREGDLGAIKNAIEAGAGVGAKDL